MKTLTLALAKGRLEEYTAKILEAGGIDCSPLKNKGRKLVINLNEHLNVVLAKSGDVVTYVEHGAADAGIVGKDLLAEMSRPVCEILDLGFGKCNFAVAAPKGVDLYSGHNAKIIATKYPEVTKKFFEKKNIDVEIIKIEGSVEVAPLLKLADGIVDIVETGTTLKANGLEIVEFISEISARFIVNPASLKFKKAEIGYLTGILRGGQALCSE